MLGLAFIWAPITLHAQALVDDVPYPSYVELVDSTAVLTERFRGWPEGALGLLIVEDPGSWGGGFEGVAVEVLRSLESMPIVRGFCTRISDVSCATADRLMHVRLVARSNGPQSAQVWATFGAWDFAITWEVDLARADGVWSIVEIRRGVVT